MVAANIGSFAYGDDEEAARLEREGAELLGHEAAIFLPTATMANQIALLVHLRPGDEFVAVDDSHVLVAEGGGPAALAGAMPISLRGQHGKFDADELRACVVRRRPGLIWIENTHTRAGGMVTTVDDMHEYIGISRAQQIPVHVDGARLVNAAVSLEVPLNALSSSADSVTLSLNKALGAPVGALLAATGQFIQQAHRVRIRLGGFWRKPGNVAAAARVALTTSADVIRSDHLHARMLAAATADISGCEVREPATNIVIARFQAPEDAARFKNSLHSEGILVGVRDGVFARFVTHYSVDDRAIEHACMTIRSYAREAADIAS